MYGKRGIPSPARHVVGPLCSDWRRRLITLKRFIVPEMCECLPCIGQHLTVVRSEWRANLLFKASKNTEQHTAFRLRLEAFAVRAVLPRFRPSRKQLEQDQCFVRSKVNYGVLFCIRTFRFHDWRMAKCTNARNGSQTYLPPSQRVTAPKQSKKKIRQLACKPGSVWLRPRPERGSHSSGTALARCLLQPTRITSPEKAGALARSTLSLFGFAPGGVYRAVHVAMSAVGSYPTLSPLPPEGGGLLSVALSLGSPPPDVIRHRLSVEPGLSSPRNLSALAESGCPANWQAVLNRGDRQLPEAIAVSGAIAGRRQRNPSRIRLH
jgi:hypothetical protein